jgi:hypothetical protein
MKIRSTRPNVGRTLALTGATLAVLLLPATAAIAAGTAVTVRVEGAKRTLLAPTVVHTRGGSITKGGAPAGACPATTAAGALDQATHHSWGGTYSSSVGGIEVLTILGETHKFTSPFFWEIWADNVPATTGICGLKLHRGERLLFAPAPVMGSVFPIGLRGPSHATSGHSFPVRVLYYNAKGVAKPLAGARVDGVVSARNGTARIKATRAATLTISASKKGYIRSAPLKVRVTR